jgi:hypothetical protein
MKLVSVCPARKSGSASTARREADVGEAQAAGDLDLGLDEVEVGRLLRDGVLDLDPRVHLDERMPPVRVSRVTRDRLAALATQLERPMTGCGRRGRRCTSLVA